MQSATKFVLVLFSCVLSSALLWFVIWNPHDHDMGVGLLGLFSNAFIGIISFYFGKKYSQPDGKQPDITQTVTKTTTLSDQIKE